VHLRLNVAGRLRAHAVVLAAIALVCVQVGSTVALLAHSYFRQDDYLILDRARLAPPGSGGPGHPRRAGAGVATCP